MELDEKTLKGHWSTNVNRGVDFFIITDAIFSKLCILGEDVEPCFEGASVTAPDVSSNFQKNDDFVKTLFSMMKELKELTYSLQNKGGETMPGTENAAMETQVAGTVNESAPVENQAPAENFSAEMGKEDSTATVENQNNVEEYKKADSKEEEKKEEGSNGNEEPEKKEDAKEEDKEDDEDKKKKDFSLEEKFALLEQEMAELKTNYAALEEENKKLVEFKANVENEKKDELINSFYMLSDEDKKDVIENKANYSLDDIEAKLSVICVRKKVSFASEEEQKEELPPAIFNLNSVGNEDSDLPAWLKQVEEKRKANN